MWIEWDASNIDEIGRHGLSVDQVEQALRGRLLVIRAAYVRNDEGRSGFATIAETVQEQGAVSASKDRKQPKKDPRVLIDDAGDIPPLASDEEELEFWRTHTPSDKFFAQAEVLTLAEFLRPEDSMPPAIHNGPAGRPGSSGRRNADPSRRRGRAAR